MTEREKIIYCIERIASMKDGERYVSFDKSKISDKTLNKFSEFGYIYKETEDAIVLDVLSEGENIR